MRVIAIGLAAASVVALSGWSMPQASAAARQERVQRQMKAAKPIHRAIRRYGTPVYAVAPTVYAPAPVTPYSYPPGYTGYLNAGGCYASREQVYVAGQGLVWRPRVDCPVQDYP